jgi:hypothetical protein
LITYRIQDTNETDEFLGVGEWVTHSSPNECGTHSKSLSLTAGDNIENLEKNDLWLVTGGLVTMQFTVSKPGF